MTFAGPSCEVKFEKPRPILSHLAQLNGNLAKAVMLLAFLITLCYHLSLACIIKCVYVSIYVSVKVTPMLQIYSGCLSPVNNLTKVLLPVSRINC